MNAPASPGLDLKAPDYVKHPRLIAWVVAVTFFVMAWLTAWAGYDTVPLLFMGAYIGECVWGADKKC